MPRHIVQQQDPRGIKVAATADNALPETRPIRADDRARRRREFRTIENTTPLNVTSGAAARRDFLADYSSLIAVMYAVTDLVAVAAAGVLSHYLAFQHLAVSAPYRIAIVMCMILMLTVSPWAGLFASWRGRSYLEHARRATLVWFAVLAILILLAFFTRVSEAVSRPWVGWLAATGWLFIVAVRLSVMAVLRELRHRGWNHKRVIIVGAGEWGAQTLRRIKNAAWLGMDVVCVVDHDPTRYDAYIEGVPMRGSYERLPELIAEYRANEVWICMPLRSSKNGVDKIEQVRRLLCNTTVTQRLLPEIGDFRLVNRPITEIIGLPVINLSTSPMHGINRLIKEIEDKVLAALILVLVSPLMLIIAILIKATSGGPVIFKQLRLGWDGRPIKVYKFRTMREHKERDGCLTQATRQDGRVTAVGRWLRRTSLDELPQFYNVLQGRMSIIGPRPHAIEHNHYYMGQIESYMQRHKVKPGISGWAQVNGLRGETDSLDKMKKRLEYDLYYIENWSLWFDIKIVLLTLSRGFVNQNAY
jgi:putative colanic acid biosynthesis UDP-glucose lipid carrier transferase